MEMNGHSMEEKKMLNRENRIKTKKFFAKRILIAKLSDKLPRGEKNTRRTSGKVREFFIRNTFFKLCNVLITVREYRELLFDKTIEIIFVHQCNKSYERIFFFLIFTFLLSTTTSKSAKFRLSVKAFLVGPRNMRG